jgi:hypothetical protein
MPSRLPKRPGRLPAGARESCRPARGPNLLAAAYKKVEWMHTWLARDQINSSHRVHSSRAQPPANRSPSGLRSPKPPRPHFFSPSPPVCPTHGDPRQRQWQRARGVAVRSCGEGGCAGRGRGQDEHPGGAVQDQRERGRARPAARAAACARGPLGVPGLPHRRRGRGRRGRRAPDGQVQLLPRRRRPPRSPPVRLINSLSLSMVCTLFPCADATNNRVT